MILRVVIATVRGSMMVYCMPKLALLQTLIVGVRLKVLIVDDEWVPYMVMSRCVLVVISVEYSIRHCASADWRF